MKRKFAPVMITAAALITTVPTTQVFASEGINAETASDNITPLVINTENTQNTAQTSTEDTTQNAQEVNKQQTSQTEEVTPESDKEQKTTTEGITVSENSAATENTISHKADDSNTTSVQKQTEETVKPAVQSDQKLTTPNGITWDGKTLSWNASKGSSQLRRIYIMETINPKSMFTKGQTAYSIALLSYKDDETEKIITHTISKVGRSFVYDEKETKYHYSNKYKAFISADAFHHQQAIFPTEKAVQEYLERSRLYFDLIRLNSYDWDDLTLAELRSVGEIILKNHKKAFVKNPTVEEINHAETLSKNVPDGVIQDADTILADLCEETSMEEPGLAYDVFNTWKAAQTSHERERSNIIPGNR